MIVLKPLKKIEAMSDTELANQFARFRPLLNRYRRKYYFVDYDKEDIEQEAWIAFVELYRTYNHQLNITFASYYNKVLRNHLNSVLRYQNAYKSASSRLIKRDFPRVKQFLWKEQFWSKSFCLLTTGGAPIDVIKKYIQNQGNNHK
ncbi:IS200/IS605-like element ISEfa4 family transposase [Enterococcus cecorum]|nr:hypothetical protein CIRMBP1296_00721 [Enterococcus cecorum]